MPRELPDRRDRLFGREADLRALAERVQFKGLTVVVARPFMGKSWLLAELARRLATDQEPRHLVGFAESSGETPDLLLRAVVDLYVRWLSHADSWQQAKMVWSQQKPNVLPGVVTTVGKIFKEIGGEVAKPVTVAVEEAINGLVAANQTLTTGGIQLPALQYDQARDLIATVAQIGNRPIGLFLDQWEKSPDPKLEAKTIEGFLHHLDEWPDCHVFMALRPDEPTSAIIEGVVASLPGPAKVYRLEPMALQEGDEGDRLARFISQTVPGAAEAEPDAILDLIDSYPGVIYQWSSDYQRARMTSIDDLALVAADAQKYRFSELEELLPALSGDRHRLAIRLALVPIGEAGAWSAIKSAVLDDLSEALVDDLKLGKVLEGADPPSFGHAKRWEAAQAWLFEHQIAAVQTEAASLITKLAARVRGADLDVVHHAAVLRSLLSVCRQISLDDLPTALCQAAATLFADHRGLDDALLRGAEQARAEEFLVVAPLLALGLHNTLHHAKAENDLARRDDLLEELRGLAGAHPEDATVGELLARALFNTMNNAKEENDLARRDDLLEELRGLAGAHPEDAAVGEQLAMGLFNTLNHASEKEDLARRDDLLEELRGLAGAHPEDAAARERLAMGLVNTVHHAKEENDLERRDGLLEELRALAGAHPDDTAVRESLAMGLFNTLNHAKEENDLARRDELLEELRGLAGAHPEDAAVGELLARGLFNTLNHAKEENDLERRDGLLEEIRALAGAHPEDAAVRERLAMGLVNTLNHAKDENDLARRNGLLEELRGLAGAHPEDAAAREHLAMGLVNTLYHAREKQDLARRDDLLEELRGLAGAHPEDAAVRERLAKGLANTLIDAKEENDLERREGLLEELRELSRADPEDAAVGEQLAMGLFNTLHHAKEENDLARRDDLLEELRGLAGAHPEDAAARERLAMGLVNTLHHAKEENDLERRDGLLEELRALAGAHAEDAAVREQLAMGLFNTLIDAKEENDLARRDGLLEELRGLAVAHPDDAAVREILAMAGGGG